MRFIPPLTSDICSRLRSYSELEGSKVQITFDYIIPRLVISLSSAKIGCPSIFAICCCDLWVRMDVSNCTFHNSDLFLEVLHSRPAKGYQQVQVD